VLTLAVINKKM